MNVTFTPEQVKVVRVKINEALHNLNSMTTVPGFRSAAHHVARAELLQSILDGLSDERASSVKPDPSELDVADALAGLIGWAQMILSQDDMPPELRARFADNHRLTTALLALLAARGKD